MSLSLKFKHGKTTVRVRPKCTLLTIVISTWQLSVDPVPFDRVINLTSVSINPDWSVLYDCVGVINYELLKHVVNVLITDDRQCWIHWLTKLSRFTPTQQRSIRVETRRTIVHWVALRHLSCVCEHGCYATNIIKIALLISAIEVKRRWQWS